MDWEEKDNFDIDDLKIYKKKKKEQKNNGSLVRLDEYDYSCCWQDLETVLMRKIKLVIQ